VRGDLVKIASLFWRLGRGKMGVVERLSLLKSHRSEILKLALQFRIESVRVFGSVAKGIDREDSDIDLLVRFEDGATLFDLIGFEQAVSDLLGVPVDVASEGGLHPILEEHIHDQAVGF
jgi:uncharacterized protein